MACGDISERGRPRQTKSAARSQPGRLGNRAQGRSNRSSTLCSISAKAAPARRGRGRSMARSSAMPPSSTSRIRSASSAASATSCVTSTAVKPDSRQMVSISPLHVEAGEGIQGAERLVEQHEARIGGQRPRERDTLFLAAR